MTVLHDVAKGYSVMELRLLGNSLTEVISDNLDRPLVTKKNPLHIEERQFRGRCDSGEQSEEE